MFPQNQVNSSYLAVHDESGNLRTDSFFGVGILFLREDHLAPIVAVLKGIRGDIGYEGEVHFNRLRSLPGRLHGGKTAVAIRWLEAMPEMVSLGLHAYVTIVNRDAPGFDSSLMPTPRHLAYNRYTRMGFEVALPWLFPDAQPMTIRMVSDDKHRALRGGDGQFDAGDNFAEYLPRAVAARTQFETKWPTVTFQPPLIELIDTTITLGTPESELVQLADVLVSGSRAAISGLCSAKPAKRKVALRAASLVRDIAKKPWEQRYGLHRRVGYAEFLGNRWADPVIARLPLAAPDQGSLPFT